MLSHIYSERDHVRNEMSVLFYILNTLNDRMSTGMLSTLQRELRAAKLVAYQQQNGGGVLQKRTVNKSGKKFIEGKENFQKEKIALGEQKKCECLVLKAAIEVLKLEV